MECRPARGGPPVGEHIRGRGATNLRALAAITERLRRRHQLRRPLTCLDRGQPARSAGRNSTHGVSEGSNAMGPTSKIIANAMAQRKGRSSSERHPDNGRRVETAEFLAHSRPQAVLGLVSPIARVTQQPANDGDVMTNRGSCRPLRNHPRHHAQRFVHWHGTLPIGRYRLRLTRMDFLLAPPPSCL
jgi:hypothetical protein